MNYYRYTGPEGQLVGIGGAGHGVVYGITDELRVILDGNADFTPVPEDEIPDPESVPTLSPDRSLLPVGGPVVDEPVADTGEATEYESDESGATE